MSRPLVSVGLPVRNGADTVAAVVESVLVQSHADLELVISDNASTDGTEEVCREFARFDTRVIYHRHPHNVGLLPNFSAAIALAQGTYFRWIGDDDWLHPDYITSCLKVFAEDPRLVLVSTGMEYRLPDRTVVAGSNADPALASDDPVRRFRAVLVNTTAAFDAVDPLYSMVRRKVAAAIPRRNMFREDEVFAAKLGLAGPWGHRGDTLAGRTWSYEPLSTLSGRLELPRWRAHVATPLLIGELLRVVAAADLTPNQRGRVGLAVMRLAGRRAVRASERAARRARSLVGAHRHLTRPDGGNDSSRRPDYPAESSIRRIRGVSGRR